LWLRSRGVQIVEASGCPGTQLGNYPHFNTSLVVLARRSTATDLDWFPVNRVIARPAGRPLGQFEQLIGQVTEHLDAYYFEVDRERRFLPIKTRDDLLDAAPRLRAMLKRLRVGWLIWTSDLA
jgi:UTP--glucose-1-phosphate uridylyltransferase